MPICSECCWEHLVCINFIASSLVTSYRNTSSSGRSAAKPVGSKDDMICNSGKRASEGKLHLERMHAKGRVFSD